MNRFKNKTNNTDKIYPKHFHFTQNTLQLFFRAFVLLNSTRTLNVSIRYEWNQFEIQYDDLEFHKREKFFGVFVLEGP